MYKPHMHQKYYDFLKILDCAIQNKKEILPQNFDLSEGYELAKRHRMTTMYFYGLLNCGLNRENPIMNSLFVDVCTEVLIDERQNSELSRIVTAFDSNHIDYMILKGAELKEMYLRSEMRTMGDIDILIKLDQYNSVKDIMLGLGYDESLESDHEFLWKNDNCIIELHKYLIPSYNKDYFAYYGDGWRFATKKIATRYFMSDEDNLIFLFTHFAKHYRDRGVGLKPIIDLWVYYLKHPDLNESYILEELKKLKLDEFYKNISYMIKVWFLDEKENQKTEFISRRILENFAYGNRHSYILSKALREKKNNKTIASLRINRIFTSVFVPYHVMSNRFPFIKKCPVLLPFMWVYFFFKRLFKTDKLRTFKNDVLLLNSKKVDNYQKELNFVGLDYNFEE